MYSIVNEAQVPLATRQAGVSPALCDSIERCLRKRPEAGDEPVGREAADAPADADPALGADRRLIAALDEGTKTVDQLAAAAKLDVAATLARLVMLEVGGTIEACGGGSYRLRRGT